MADLLSPEWFEQLRDKLASIAPLGDATHELALGQVVEDAPEGAVGWTIHLGGGKAARFELGVDQAEVTIIENLDTMSALIAGATTTELLYEGRIKISGDVSALLHSAELLAQLNSALSS
jgi:hypothetical protein